MGAEGKESGACGEALGLVMLISALCRAVKLAGAAAWTQAALRHQLVVDVLQVLPGRPWRLECCSPPHRMRCSGHRTATTPRTAPTPSPAHTPISRSAPQCTSTTASSRNILRPIYNPSPWHIPPTTPPPRILTSRLHHASTGARLLRLPLLLLRAPCRLGAEPPKEALALRGWVGGPSSRGATVLARGCVGVCTGGGAEGLWMGGSGAERGGGLRQSGWRGGRRGEAGQSGFGSTATGADHKGGRRQRAIWVSQHPHKRGACSESMPTMTIIIPQYA